VLRKPSLATALRAEVRRHSTVELKKAQKRLRKLQKQVTELRRQAQGQTRVMDGMRRRISGLRSGMRQAGAAVARRGGPQVSPQAIRAVRDRLRMTREQFAKLVGVSPGSIFGWESGRTLPRRGSVGRLMALRKVGVRAARAQLSGVGRAVRGRARRR
jgi:DNA-binding transcriptional regulator YiaG